MYFELTVLKTYVSLVLLAPATCPYGIMMNSTIIECERLKKFMFTRFNKRKHTDRSIGNLNEYHYSIIEIANHLMNTPKSGDKIISEMLVTVIGLIKHTEALYGHLLDKSMLLPVFIVEELHQNLRIQMQEITEGLNQKKIPVPLIEQLNKAVFDLFKPQQISKLCYGHSHYIALFIPQLKSLALADQDKDWNLKLLLLLIKYNFNHLGTYRFFSATQRKNAAKIKDYTSWNQHFFDQRLWLEEIQVVPFLAYDAETPSLKELLLKHLQAIEQHTKNKLKIAQQQLPEKIHLTISVDELTLHFYYNYLAGMYNPQNKKDAAELICKNVRTKGTHQISPRSLLKFDKVALNSAAIKLHQKLRRIQTQIAEDFDL